MLPTITEKNLVNAAARGTYGTKVQSQIKMINRTSDKGRPNEDFLPSIPSVSNENTTPSIKRKFESNRNSEPYKGNSRSQKPI